MTEPYDDIINLPHHVSATRPHMSSANRAAQFSPFAALTGYDAALVEAARLTDKRIELGESAIDELAMKLYMLTDRIADHPGRMVEQQKCSSFATRPEVAVTYFQTDEKKEGGAYVTVTGAVKKVDDYENVIVLVNGEKISIEDILNIECDLFNNLI